MVKLVVAYGQPEDPAAFDQHYAGTHIPLVERIPNLRRFEAGKVLGTADGSAAPYYFIAELLFDTAEELQASAIMSVTPPLAKFPTSAAAACPSGLCREA
jgi:uncharacterized protein (TIGR02118 family)